ncbi:MAG TPA: DUF4188 domain-containing protein [Candidatus Limnocylindrales bacterium]|nr:DUF4188 domain-containing protein [Candidatus Limnocylindrales bacterium]
MTATAAMPASARRPERTMADLRGPVTVFLIGMRINRFRSLRAWLPAANAMGPMLRELFADPELGMLGAKSYWSGRTITVVSYWRSFEHLERYAHSPANAHRPAWTAFYRRAGAATGAVGIFHETYTIQPGQAESLYVDVPSDFGLGGAVGVVPVTGSLEAARQRRDRAGDAEAGAGDAEAGAAAA